MYKRLPSLEVFVGLVSVLFLSGFILLAITVGQKEELIQRLEDRIAIYDSTFRYEEGTSLTHGDYHLFTADSGVHWYNVKRFCLDPHGCNTQILGEADPNVVKYMEALEVLSRRATSGTLPLDVNVPGDQQLLRELGFEIKERE